MAELDFTVHSKPLAREIAEYDDRELDRYLEANGRVISVQDPENIQPAFIQRLRDKVQASRAAARSHPLDMEQLNARLQDASADIAPSDRVLLPSPTPSLPSQEEQDAEDLRRETASYPALVDAGGRPPYPLPLLQDFFWNPEQYLEHPAYHDIITFWRMLDGEKRTFCAGHLYRWRRFCRLQRIIRERSVESEWTMIDAAEWDSWEEYVERYGPKEGRWGFSDYARRVKWRLAKYGFTRPFQLESDLARQDKLTTWIEYLGYEYWFYDQKATYVKHYKPRHDEAWKKLVNSGLLRPGETSEMIRDFDCKRSRAGEEDSAAKAVQSATAAVLAAEEAVTEQRGSRGSQEDCCKRMLAAEATLNEARVAYESIRERNSAISDFIQPTKEYRNAQGDAERQNYLLRWIQQQIPLIELEVSCSSVKHDIGHPDESRELNPTQVNDVHRAQRFKRRRQNGADSHSVLQQEAWPESASQECEKRMRSDREAVHDSRLSKRPRNSYHGEEAASLTPGFSNSTNAPIVESAATRAQAGRSQELEVSNASSCRASTRKPGVIRRSARIAQQSKDPSVSAQISIAPRGEHVEGVETTRSQASSEGRDRRRSDNRGQHSSRKSKGKKGKRRAVRTLQGKRSTKERKEESTVIGNAKQPRGIPTSRRLRQTKQS